MPKGIFVTGTDTEVGKTYFSCLILRHLRSKGIDVGAMKPVETGCEAVDEASGEESSPEAVPPGGAHLAPADAAALIEAAGGGDDLSLVAPCRYETPVAPMVAAEKEGRGVDLDEIMRCYRQLSSDHSFMLVEGAGGLLVPVRPDYLMVDLAFDMNLPVVVVAVSRLGVINHTLMTIEGIRNRGLDVAGIVLNNIDSAKNDAKRTNAEVLKRLVPEPVFELAYGATEKDLTWIEEML
jgi:dethiobiotin synthetase